MSAVRLLEKLYNCRSHVNVNPIVAQCAVALTAILRNNPDRLQFVIINLGANDIYISPDTLAAANHGILLAAAGGHTTSTIFEDFSLTTWDWYGVAIGAASDILVIETEGEIID